jgi:hypothetical protein
MKNNDLNEKINELNIINVKNLDENENKILDLKN